MAALLASRARYAKIRARSQATSNQAFDRAVREALGPGEHTPAEWLRAAQECRFACKRCAGSGIFVTYVENGVPRGPGGSCYRCQGKGWQDDSDAVRNDYYDRHGFAMRA